MKPKSVSMQKLKDVLRLHHEASLSLRKIAKCLSLSLGVVSKYLSRAEAAGLGWPLPEGMTDTELLAILQPGRAPATPSTRPAGPDWAQIQQELKRKGMTLQLLWEEYRDSHASATLSYPHFCRLYRAWAGQCKLSMRQTHRAGEKLFVDYCGPTLSVINPDTGEIRQAQVFVAVLGASSYTYAEATWSQRVPDWIASHVRAFEFIGGVSEIVVPDNLKSAVTKACRYDPDLNPTYQQLAAHYHVAIVPARPYKPKDKAKVEVGVQIVERWIFMRLRKHTFFTLSTLNQAIRLLVDELNFRPFKKRPGSRLEQFRQLDKPALKPLPLTPYEYTEVKKARVHLDYHVEYDGHFYSVPYQLVKQEVLLHTNSQLVRIFSQGKQVALHPRAFTQGTHTTDPEHRAKAHRKQAEWTPTRFLSWAESIGPQTRAVIEHQLATRKHPEHGYRACLGLLSLAKKYGRERLEAACARALKIGGLQYRNIASILSKGLDQIEMENTIKQAVLPLDHDNVRGPGYYH